MTEREMFEKWASGQWLNVSEKSFKDLYIYSSTADAWAGWQARATPALPQVPEGMAIVPVEPTRAMCKAATSYTHSHDAKLIYKAMLAAAKEKQS